MLGVTPQPVSGQYPGPQTHVRGAGAAGAVYWGGTRAHVSAGSTAAGVCGFLRGTLEGTPGCSPWRGQVLLSHTLTHKRKHRPGSASRLSQGPRREVSGRTRGLLLRGGSSAAWCLRGWGPGLAPQTGRRAGSLHLKGAGGLRYPPCPSRCWMVATASLQRVRGSARSLPWTQPYLRRGPARGAHSRLRGHAGPRAAARGARFF